MIKAQRYFGSELISDDFTESLWKSGIPQQAGWRKVDSIESLTPEALPELSEVQSKRNSTTVLPPDLGEIIADEETSQDLEVPESLPEESSESKPDENTPTAPEAEKAKRGRKPAVKDENKA